MLPFLGAFPFNNALIASRSYSSAGSMSPIIGNAGNTVLTWIVLPPSIVWHNTQPIAPVVFLHLQKSHHPLISVWHSWTCLDRVQFSEACVLAWCHSYLKLIELLCTSQSSIHLHIFMIHVVQPL